MHAITLTTLAITQAQVKPPQSMPATATPRSREFTGGTSPHPIPVRVYLADGWRHYAVLYHAVRSTPENIRALLPISTAHPLQPSASAMQLTSRLRGGIHEVPPLAAVSPGSAI